jgi:hypothetical protein
MRRSAVSAADYFAAGGIDGAEGAPSELVITHRFWSTLVPL